MRKPLMAVAIVACLIMTVVGGLVPILQGWIFFVIALYLLATEFESGRRWVKAARRRWPWLDRWIERARDHRWAPRHLKEFEDLTERAARRWCRVGAIAEPEQQLRITVQGEGTRQLEPHRRDLDGLVQE